MLRAMQTAIFRRFLLVFFSFIAERVMARRFQYALLCTAVVVLVAVGSVEGHSQGEIDSESEIGRLLEAGKPEAALPLARASGEGPREIVKIGYRIAPEDSPAFVRLAADLFQEAQAIEGFEIGDALAHMAVRSSISDPALAKLVRERQDLDTERPALEWQILRNGVDRATGEQRLAAIARRVAEIDAQLAKDFPDYRLPKSSRTSSIAEVQQQLGDDEMLVFVLETGGGRWSLPAEDFIWVVTRTDMRWRRSRALGDDAFKLLCGLNPDFTGDLRGRHCFLPSDDAPEDIPKPSADGKFVLDFDPARAHALYTSLFGQVKDLIAGKKNILFVASEGLSILPLHVLVTEPPSEGKPTAWLMRRHTVTVLPSVASLVALRAHAAPSAPGRRPYVAFANPLLTGRPTNAKHRTLALLAAQKGTCRDTEAISSLGEFGGLFAAATLGASNAEEIAALTPVPQTADVACRVGKALGSGEDDVYLAVRATETQVKAMSASGALASYATLMMATHGVLGHFDGRVQPGLALTPPADAGQGDDGFLSATEIAALRLDADLVILAACNSAAEGGKGDAPLSGLARAFFFAGARALLASQWPVREDAALALVSNMLEARVADPALGLAEALRLSMLPLADSPDPTLAHPSYWAPFIVVGEGAALATR